MARPTEPGRKHGLRKGLRDRSNLELSKLLAEIKVENHEFIRAVAKSKGMSVSSFMDEWIDSKRVKTMKTLYNTSNSPVNSQSLVP
jgi:hypothetical protein